MGRAKAFTETIGWISPTSHEEGDWNNEENAYDDDVDSFAYLNISGVWSPYLILNTPSTETNQIRLYLSSIPLEDTTVNIQIRKDDQAEDVYTGSFPAQEWFTISFSEGMVDQIKIRAKYTGMFIAKICVHEADVGECVLVGSGHAKAGFSSGKAKASFQAGRAKAIVLFGIADPDIVDEDVVLALSSSKTGKAKASFKTGRAKGYLS